MIASLTASTIACRTPCRAARRSARGSPPGPRSTTAYGTSPTLRLALPLQHAHQVGVGHRRQRVVAHVAVGEQQLADEQMALEDGAPVLREGRAGDREVGAERVEQRLADRADVAARRCESKVEQYLNRICRAPCARSQRERGERLARPPRRPAMVRDLSATTTASASPGSTPVLGHADQLHRAHAVAHQHVGEVGGAGEVVGDAAEQDATWARVLCLVASGARSSAPWPDGAKHKFRFGRSAMHVVITGGAGFIGKKLAARAPRARHAR